MDFGGWFEFLLTHVGILFGFPYGLKLLSFKLKSMPKKSTLVRPAFKNAMSSKIKDLCFFFH